MRFITKVDRYIAGMIFVPMVGTLVIAAMLLLLDKMLKLFDFVVNEGGPVTVVWRMLGNLIPQYLALGVPIGLFLGVLLAFRKLAINSELDSLIGTGVSYARLLPLLAILNLTFLSHRRGLGRGDSGGHNACSRGKEARRHD